MQHIGLPHVLNQNSAFLCLFLSLSLPLPVSLSLSKKKKSQSEVKMSNRNWLKYGDLWNHAKNPECVLHANARVRMQSGFVGAKYQKEERGMQTLFLEL